MRFLSPLLLWLLPLALAPLVARWWRVRKAKPAPLGTTATLRRVAARAAARTRWPHRWRHLRRGGAVALLVLAAARPVTEWPNPLVAESARPADGSTAMVVLLIDRATAMNYRVDDHRTRLDLAREQARAVLDRLRPEIKVAVCTADDEGNPIVSSGQSQDHAEARRALDAIRAGGGGASLGKGQAAAWEVLSGWPTGERTVCIFTDGRTENWRPDVGPSAGSGDRRFDQTHFVWVRTDGVHAENAAVADVRIVTPLVTPGARVAAVATVANHSGRTWRDLLTVNVLGKDVACAAVEIAPGSAAEVPFDFELPAFVGSRAVRGTASLQGDRLPDDDRFFFHVAVHQPARVAVFEGVNTGPERGRSGFYLQRALAAGAPGGTLPPGLPAAALAEANLDDYTAVFLAGVGTLDERAQARLRAYLTRGGTVAWFAGGRGDMPEAKEKKGWPVVAGEPHEVANGLAGTQVLAKDDPILSGVWGDNAPFPPLPLRRLFAWKPSVESETLLAAGGLPFLVRKRVGAGQVYAFNAAADLSTGDFPLSPAFLPLVERIARQSGARGQPPGSYRTGESITLPVALAGQGGERAVLIGLPDGSKIIRRRTPEAPLFARAPQAGFYQAGSVEAPGAAEFAVNVATADSTLAFLPAREHEAKAETVVGLDGVHRWLDEGEGLRPWWWVPLLLAAALSAWEYRCAKRQAREYAGACRAIATGRLLCPRAGGRARRTASHRRPSIHGA